MAIVLLVLGAMALQVLSSFLRSRQRLRLRELVHRERMLALEKGFPVPDDPFDGDDSAWFARRSNDRLLDDGWDRRVSLAAGLVMLFAGAGGLLFAWLSPPISNAAVDLKVAGGLGVIPLMASLGLLLYYRLTAPPDRPESHE